MGFDDLNYIGLFHFIGVQGYGRKIPGGRINWFSRANKSEKTTFQGMLIHYSKQKLIYQ